MRGLKWIKELPIIRLVKTTYVTIAEAKLHLGQLINRALAGERIVICRRSVPLVRLEPIRRRKAKTP